LVAATERDDWRLTVEFETEAHASWLFARFREHAAAALAEDRLKHGLAVLRDGAELRVYAASYEALRRAQEVICSFLELGNVKAEELAERHDRESGGWTHVELPPVPERDAEHVVEHHGAAGWGAETEPGRVQVRFELADRAAAIAFAERLHRDGYDVHRRWSYLFLFADDDAAAKKLVPQLSAQAPGDARLFYMEEGPRMWFI
jgi:hypothetical protein